MAEKDRQHRTYVISLLTIFLWFLVMLGSVPAEEEASSRRQAEYTVVQSEKVSVFIDRTTLKEGESLKLIIQCESPYTLLSEPEILHSDSFSLQSKGVDSDYKREYLITGTRAGKYNIRVHVKYKTGGAKDSLSGMAIREIKNIDVRKGNGLKTLVGLIPIITAFIAFIAGLGTSIVSVWINERIERRKKKKWILNFLLPQLRVTQKDIDKSGPVEYETWMREFYGGGYHSALRKLSGKLEGKHDLCGDIAAIHSLLKRYERELEEKVKIPKEMRDELNQNLSRVIGALEPLILRPR